MVVLMALSRMFLGRHFLADVIGGAVVGSLLVAVIYAGVVRPGRFLDDPSPTLQWGTQWGLPLLILLGLPLGLMVLAPQVEPQNVGRVLGLNLAFVWLAHTGIPDDEASWPRRLARAALAPLIFVLAGVVLPRLALGLGLDPVANATSVSLAAVQGFLVLWGTVALARRSELYRS